MKKATLYMIISFIVVAIVITSANAAQRIIRVDKTCQSLPGLTMRQVTITDDNTLIDFEWEGTEDSRAISIYSPDMESAFAIKDKRSSKVYKLQRAEGIDYYPNKTSIKEGEVKKFTLVFDKLPYHYLNVFEEAAQLIVSVDYY